MQFCISSHHYLEINQFMSTRGKEDNKKQPAFVKSILHKSSLLSSDRVTDLITEIRVTNLVNKANISNETIWLYLDIVST